MQVYNGFILLTQIPTSNVLLYQSMWTMGKINMIAVGNKNNDQYLYHVVASNTAR